MLVRRCYSDDVSRTYNASRTKEVKKGKKIASERRRTDETVFVRPSLEESKSKIEIDESYSSVTSLPSLLHQEKRTDETKFVMFIFSLQERHDGRTNLIAVSFYQGKRTDEIKFVKLIFFMQKRYDGRTKLSSSYC